MNRLLLGIDVGSTTAKIALVDGHERLILSEYRRHFAEQANCVRKLLEQVARQFPDTELKVAVCGSGARPIAAQLGVDFVQEVVANSIAIHQIDRIYEAGADYVYLNRFEAAWTLQRAIAAGLESDIDAFRTQRQSRNHYRPDRQEILS